MPDLPLTYSTIQTGWHWHLTCSWMLTGWSKRTRWLSTENLMSMQKLNLILKPLNQNQKLSCWLTSKLIPDWLKC
ncbi:hypothetical protein LBLM1_03995 [Limosilactobacillus mucosae LM1]|uniref:Uncharacterized protein n=1 Tax=Limosilactobacillus mucosae LM1 TaxID=1130798 RepID=A0A0D4CK83_LIMMU|nr:hypothetical protein LBLM1_03995 [Limosilactobacillus mucosae LM1]